MDVKEYLKGKCIKYNLDERIAGHFLNFLDVFDHEILTSENVKRTLSYNTLRYFTGETLESLSWITMCRQLSTNGKFKEGASGNVIRPFYKYLLSQGVSLGEHTDYLRENLWLFDELGSIVKRRLYREHLNPENLFRYNQFNSNSHRGNNDLARHSYYDLNCDTEPLRELLRNFIVYRLESALTQKGLHLFVYEFEHSMKGLMPQPIKAEDFNYKVFHEQFNFYYSLTQKETGFKYTSIAILKEFYLFLFTLFKESGIDPVSIFPINCGVNERFLLRKNFINEYVRGGRLIAYNPFDDKPTLDIWILDPNGNEDKTLGTHKDEYILFDFTPIKDKNIRTLAKEFIWTNQTQRNIKNKRQTLYAIEEYLEWAEEQMKRKSTGNVTEIDKKKYSSTLTEKLFADYYYYLSFTKNQFVFKEKWIKLRQFVRFLVGIGYPINDKIFDVIEIPTPKTSKPKTLSPEETRMLLGNVKSQIDKDNHKIEMLWDILQLLITTNFRIQEIINLKRYCLDKGKVIKDGSYPVWMQRKGTDGEYMTVPTNSYVHWTLQHAIAKTEFLAVKAEAGIGEYVFLIKGIRNKSVVRINTHWVEKRFAEQMKSIGLEDKGYTPYNLRHRYMSDLVERAKKQGKSLLQILPLLGHATPSTALKFYYQPDMGNYLEALSGVIIGDVSITGEIVKKVEDAVFYKYSDINEITVAGGLGVCSQEHCNPFGNDKNPECLLGCKSFKVPVDKLPYFESAIEEVDRQIVKENIYHEKEHLLAKKRLYVAYIKAILEFKSNLKGGQEIE